MRSRTRVLLAALAVLVASPGAGAVGLGPIEVESGLNEPFSARIALTGLAPGELDTMRVALADEDAFARAGIERVPLLAALRFTPVAAGEHAGYLHVSSRGLVREPGFSFVIAVKSAGRLVQRRYDVLLNLKR